VVINFYGIELSDIVSIAALSVSTFLFYVGHTRGRRSEQFRFSLQVWDRIEAQEIIIKDWNLEGRYISTPLKKLDLQKALEKAVESLESQLTFFIHLTEKGEIKDRNVKEYYSGPLLAILVHAFSLDKQYPDPGPLKGRIVKIIRLIERYHELIGRMKEYRNAKEVLDKGL
jgi:hypothetical protein